MKNTTNQKKSYLIYPLKWLVICLMVGLFSGLASAFFLVSLEWVSTIRDGHLWIIWLLPFGGLLIGLLYHYYGKEVVKGTNLILEEYEHSKKTIPLKMMPLVLFTTLITHLFGGSAGREGTAVQMGSSIADQFSVIFKLSKPERKTLLIIGISAGFASIFGTPFAGAIFAIEVLFFSKVVYRSILPSFFTAFVAFYVVEFLQIKHTHYSIPNVPEFTFSNLGWVLLVSILFGLTAMLFSKTTHFFGTLFCKFIAFPPARPLIGGIILAIAFYFIGTTKFVGLGIPQIENAFHNPSASFDFLMKLLFTTFTLGAGFKGGEVTPLFFIGATLGSALSVIVPLPVALLAGMGFVAVFSGATHTPIACLIMGIELFGIDCGIYIGIACVIAYFCSGLVGIYSSQIVKGPKESLYKRFRKESFQNI
jgi:H+/Cl- antiporter ClcA